MALWYAICDLLPFEMLSWTFMCNALLAVLLMGPLFGTLSTMIVSGRMSFFSMLQPKKRQPSRTGSLPGFCASLPRSTS